MIYQEFAEMVNRQYTLIKSNRIWKTVNLYELNIVEERLLSSTEDQAYN